MEHDRTRYLNMQPLCTHPCMHITHMHHTHIKKMVTHFVFSVLINDNKISRCWKYTTGIPLFSCQSSQTIYLHANTNVFHLPGSLWTRLFPPSGFQLVRPLQGHPLMPASNHSCLFLKRNPTSTMSLLRSSKLRVVVLFQRHVVFGFLLGDNPVL